MRTPDHLHPTVSCTDHRAKGNTTVPRTSTSARHHHHYDTGTDELHGSKSQPDRQNLARDDQCFTSSGTSGIEIEDGRILCLVLFGVVWCCSLSADASLLWSFFAMEVQSRALLSRLTAPCGLSSPPAHQSLSRPALGTNACWVFFFLIFDFSSDS